MKTLEETFVIIDTQDSGSTMIQNFVSYDETELQSICENLNYEKNENRKRFQRKGTKKIYENIVFYKVVNLQEAIHIYDMEFEEYKYMISGDC